MKIKNKKASRPSVKITSARFTVMMEKLSSNSHISFDDVREEEGKTPEELTDGEIHYAALEAGLEVAP